MLHSNVELLEHILEETKFILHSVQQKNRNEIVNDPILSRAIIRSLEIIGEASAKVDPDFKLVHPNIEWRKMSGTRNRLIHDYFGVDYDIVLDIIENKLPTLQVEMEELISQSNFD